MTPETDRAFDGDLSVGLQPEITTWSEAKEFAQYLENDRNKYRDEAANLQRRANETRDYNLATIALLGALTDQMFSLIDKLAKDIAP